MRRQLQAVACLGSLAALSFPAPTAQARASQTQAAQAPGRTAQTAQAHGQAAQTAQSAQTALTAQGAAQACRVVAAKPVVSAGKIRGTVSRAGCSDQARLRVRVTRAVPGPDRVVKSGSQIVGNGRITAKTACGPTPRRYYVVALDSQGRTSTSKSVKLSCGRATAGKSFASAAETAVVKLTNEARAGQGCRPLVHDATLHLAAERHSADMAVNDYFEHDSRDGRTFDQRIRATGFAFRLAGENIAKGQPTAVAVVEAWLDSPGHRANILNCSFTRIGVGHHAKGPTWTQDFATR